MVYFACVGGFGGRRFFVVLGVFEACKCLVAVVDRSNRVVRCGHHGTVLAVFGDGSGPDTFAVNCPDYCSEFVPGVIEDVK